jgi:hypothetical protein
MNQVIPISEHSEPEMISRRSSGDPIRTIARAAMAKAIQVSDRSHKPEHIAAQRWPFDHDVQLLLRAATAPRDMVNSAALVAIATAVLPMMESYSAAARLFDSALSVSFGVDGAINVPSLPVANVAFVRGGGMKPVVQALSAGARLDPHKLAGIAVATEEMLMSSSAETLIRDMLASSSGPALDAVVLSSAAASPDAPAGILHGITPVAAAAAPAGDALFSDMIALGSAISPVAGAGRTALIMNPAQMFSLMLRTFRAMEPDVLVLPSGAVAPGTIIAVALNGLVSAVDPPEFESGTQATLSMNDASTAWPGGPVTNLFQTASAAVKMVTRVSWAVRSPSAVAMVTGTAW